MMLSKRTYASLEVISWILVFVIGVALGMAYDEKGVVKNCNEFIMETYVNITYDICNARCQQIKIFEKTNNALPDFIFNISVEGENQNGK